MNLVIYINENFEDSKALVDLNQDKVLLNGDEYHDKIYEKMEGYVQALNDFNIYDVKFHNIPQKEIGEDHEYYQDVNF